MSVDELEARERAENEVRELLPMLRAMAKLDDAE